MNQFVKENLIKSLLVQPSNLAAELAAAIQKTLYEK